MILRTYSDLIKISDYEGRFNYLKLYGEVGDLTFGYNRYINQLLYRSRRWRDEVRPAVIIRDNGCDLAIGSREIQEPDILIVHHMNPITAEQILDDDPLVYALEYLICTSLNTHNGIHYGKSNISLDLPIERSPNDMCPWRD